MDICHLKKSGGRTPKYQKYKGRVVLRGGTVKDDSGSYAVFTKQGSSASVIARLQEAPGNRSGFKEACGKTMLDVCCDLTPYETSRWLELRPDRENVSRSGTGSITYGTNATPD